MSDRDERKAGRKPKVEKLELNKETVQNLNEGEAEAAEGGRPPNYTGKCPNSNGCTKAAPCNTFVVPCKGVSRVYACLRRNM